MSAATTTWTNAATGMAYEPFAALRQATLGNGLSMTNSWGDDPGSGSGAGGRLASRRLYLTSTGKNRSLLSYTYDNDDNITAITDGVNGANSVAYGYDVRGRLSMVEQQRSGQVIYNRTDYLHDANGNRTALERRFTQGQIEPDTVDSYALTPGTNRLASITTASLTRTLIYDNRGNLSTATRGPAVTATTDYDGHGRLIGYARTSEDSVSHSYNGLDDRAATARTPAGGGNADIRRFVTAPDGRAIGEYGSSASDVRAEFIWLNPEVGDSGMFGGDDGLGGYMPIALATAASGGGTTLSWVHADHLGTPIVITDATGTAIPQPGGYTTPAFPGQSRTLADLYYNRYRDYDPTTGRYIQADPIGLAGGQSPYSYAMGNPLRYTDPLGLRNVNWFGPWDDSGWNNAADNAPTAKGICRIFAHGSRDNIISGYGWDTEYLRKQPKDMNDLADQITKLCPDENIIELWSCNTGQGEINIATELARLSRRRVRAPDKLIWHKGDQIFTTPRDRAGNPGNWHEFDPDGGSQVIPNPNL